MDVIEAIMKIFSDIFALNDIPGETSNLLTGGMSYFFQGILALVQVLQNMFGILGAL